MALWHVAVTFQGIVSEKEAGDLTQRLSDYGAAVSVDRDFVEASVVLTLQEAKILEAAAAAIALVTEAAPKLSRATGIEVACAESEDLPVREPMYPELIGLRGVCRIAGVGPERARQFLRSPSFPSPTYLTPQGPLFWKHAVEHWLFSRDLRQSQASSRSTSEVR